jgi:hypothetical protein
MVRLQNIIRGISAAALAAILTVAPGNAEAFDVRSQSTKSWTNSTLLRDGVVYKDRMIADRNGNPINIEAEKYRIESIREISIQNRKGHNIASIVQTIIRDRDGNVLSKTEHEHKHLKDRNGRLVDIEAEKHSIIETKKEIIKDKDGRVLSKTKSLKEKVFGY